MAVPEGLRQFEEEVFPAELEEIRRRREELGLDATGLAGSPSVGLGLQGIAFSGGGIRSATFCLGVVEAAANAGLLKRADYPATVSGGGYIGSCLSSVLNDPTKEPEGRKFPFHHELGIQEPAAYRQLRNGSNYLAPGGILNKMRLPALVLRGIVLNFLLFLPLVMLAVFLTEVLYELGTRSPVDFHFVPLIALGAFLVMILTFPIVARTLRRWLGWKRRDRYERILASVFAVTLLLMVWLPLMLVVIGAAGFTWEGFREGALAEVASPFEGRDYWKWILVLLAIVAFLFVGQASERVAQVRGRLLLYLVGLIGPGVLFLIYILLCVYQLDSPFLKTQFAESLDRAEISAELRDELGQRGVVLGPDATAVVQKPGKVWALRDGEDEHRISARA
ncbi:MAG: hypothetical protein JRS35_20225, partial [Deltaproteobacteria bacterium]|nr:hypothetical protein [Deltaproteobacteria bacterium]